MAANNRGWAKPMMIAGTTSGALTMAAAGSGREVA
jgi:hypothetical protein